MSTSPPTISFIIPARNEEASIKKTIDSIRLHCCLSHEIIVVDHNSTDNTFLVAKEANVKVIKKVGGTIGSVRNKGATIAAGSVLIFLDADVSLTTSWQENISNVLLAIKDDPFLLTGSHCSAPDDDGWLSKLWFSRFSQSESTVHIGSGHLIMSRELYDRLDGFSEAITTGEDYDICSRAKALGSKIVNAKSLKVVHRDYPKSLIGLIKREAWHGLGDAWPPRKILQSKVAIASIIFIALHFLLLLIMTTNIVPLFFIVLPIGLITSLIFLSSFLKFKHNGYKLVLFNTLIFYFYYLGRSASFIMRAIK